MKSKIVATIFVVLATPLTTTNFSSALAEIEERDYAESMMIITNPSRKERERVEKRFRFVIPRIVESCTDLSKKENYKDTAGKILGLHNREIKETGLQEDLLAFTENLHRIAIGLQRVSIQENTKLRCLPPFVLYTMLRNQGLSATEARNELVASIAIHGLQHFYNQIPNQ